MTLFLLLLLLTPQWELLKKEMYISEDSRTDQTFAHTQPFFYMAVNKQILFLPINLLYWSAVSVLLLQEGGCKSVASLFPSRPPLYSPGL